MRQVPEVVCTVTAKSSNCSCSNNFFWTHAIWSSYSDGSHGILHYQGLMSKRLLCRCLFLSYSPFRSSQKTSVELISNAIVKLRNLGTKQKVPSKVPSRNTIVDEVGTSLLLNLRKANCLCVLIIVRNIENILCIPNELSSDIKTLFIL